MIQCADHNWRYINGICIVCGLILATGHTASVALAQGRQQGIIERPAIYDSILEVGVNMGQRFLGTSHRSSGQQGRTSRCQ
jgi:hypothetical protein